MPSAFSIISDPPVKLSQSDKFERVINISVPGIDDTQPSLLLYRVHPPSNQVTLELDINNGAFKATASFSGEAQTFHEVIGANILRSNLNVFRLKLPSNSGSIEVSDIVLLYVEK